MCAVRGGVLYADCLANALYPTPDTHNGRAARVFSTLRSQPRSPQTPRQRELPAPTEPAAQPPHAQPQWTGQGHARPFFHKPRRQSSTRPTASGRFGPHPHGHSTRGSDPSSPAEAGTTDTASTLNRPSPFDSDPAPPISPSIQDPDEKASPTQPPQHAQDGPRTVGFFFLIIYFCLS